MYISLFLVTAGKLCWFLQLYMGMLSAMVRYAAVNNQMKFVQGEGCA